ncbi:hypothetical protein A2160_03865 [Candidatus Beckwithbacteria bacterium RBG_13_42_9]|uniref:Transposase IS200-like domain-containing protein n=1 Tax=Candidatus Beckwithbacteria bacterium RBG_13_42_9 TaxID=1797457 RepID=A0A1F5E4W1_9BACT|nr:MAG: hypothetical protein A2160_03865 [Candidatus Beckwithbacteria bacterium RBG_13_42_9]
MRVTISGGYKNLRLKDYDYKNGWFFITNKTNFSQPYLKEEILDLVKREIKSINKICSGVNLDFATVVPTHVHAILVFQNSQLPLSDVWRRFKARTTLFAKRGRLLTDKSLWQRNYFEHVIRTDKALSKIREYIQNNPLKENLPLSEIYE